jgi:hypothetical protein
MPVLHEVLLEVQKRASGVFDSVRREHLAALVEHTNRPTILFASAYTVPRPDLPPQVLSVTPWDIQGLMSALHGLGGDSLDLIIHSPGGSMEAADQIVQYLRRKFKNIRAIVPQNAMSAATMIACACDSIVMGKQSAIGPIDPQISMPSPHGTMSVSAQAILDEFEQAKREIAKNQASAVLWHGRLQYPPGFLKACEATLATAQERVAHWLDSYMFASAERKQGKEIAAWLANANEHKTHGRPLGIELAREHGLTVVALEDDQRLQELVLSVFHSAMATFLKTPCVKIIENHEGRGLYLTVDVQRRA